MAYVPVPKDLTKIKTKVALNLTKRQLICFSLAAVVGIPTYLLARGMIGNSAAVLVMIGLMLPFFFLAMFERDGQPAEKVIRNYIRAKLWPGTRPYITENLYKYLDEEGKTIATQNKTATTATAASAKKHRSGKRK
ncbi:MAG: PrgI family protein [Oscillospiraceae bacterium]|nr:PrgI family protein [Oscillospiraceae bacterium]